MQRIFGKVLHGRREREMIFLCQRLKIHPGNRVVLDVIEAACLNGPVQNRLVPVGNDKVGVGDQLRAETRADRARAVGIVEREHARRQLRQADAAVFAGVVLREDGVFVPVHLVENHKPAGKRQRGLDRVCQTPRKIGLHDQTVDHNVDVVFFVLVELDFLGKIVDAFIDARTHKAAASGVVEHLRMLALFAAHDGGENLKACFLRKTHDLIDNLVDRLALDFLSALRAVRHAAARPQKAQIVVDLRHRADRGAGVFAGGLLVDGDGWG